MMLNKAETSLHADRTRPLVWLIRGAAMHGQVIVVSHAAALVAALAEASDCRRIVLGKRLGETMIENAEPLPWT